MPPTVYLVRSGPLRALNGAQRAAAAYLRQQMDATRMFQKFLEPNERSGSFWKDQSESGAKTDTADAAEGDEDAEDDAEDDTALQEKEQDDRDAGN